VQLGGADLRDTVLDGASLASADLSTANLHRADLSNTGLHDADLQGANLTDVRARGAHAIGTNLSDAKVVEASLVGVTFFDAKLARVDFGYAVDFDGADCGGVSLSDTVLVGVRAFALCDASPPTEHWGPSHVDFTTVAFSMRSPKLRTFLQQTGMPEVVIDYLVESVESLDGSIIRKLLQSTYIAYGNDDELFARQLFAALHRNGVKVFFFAEHAVPGKKIGRTIREGVNSHDRVVIVCSHRSLEQRGILAEIEEVLDRERREGRAELLIPVLLDDYVLDGWTSPHPDVAVTPRERVAADFRGWDADTTKFDAGMLKLIAALKK
jgi:hypothetical protein